MGQSKAYVREFIKDTLHLSVQEEEGCEYTNGEIQEWIDVKEHFLMFWFRDDALYLIDLGC